MKLQLATILLLGACSFSSATYWPYTQMYKTYYAPAAIHAYKWAPYYKGPYVAPVVGTKAAIMAPVPAIAKGVIMPMKGVPVPVKGVPVLAAPHVKGVPVPVKGVPMMPPPVKAAPIMPSVKKGPVLEAPVKGVPVSVKKGYPLQYYSSYSTFPDYKGKGVVPAMEEAAFIHEKGPEVVYPGPGAPVEPMGEPMPMPMPGPVEGGPLRRVPRDVGGFQTVRPLRELVGDLI